MSGAGVAIFYTLSAFLVFLAGWMGGLGFPFFVLLLAFAGHLFWQARQVRPGAPTLALRLFRSNRDAGLLLALGLALGALAVNTGAGGPQMKKRPAAAVCLALFLAGCSRHGSQTGSTKVETSTTTTASTVPATTEAPLTYKQTTPRRRGRGFGAGGGRRDPGALRPDLTRPSTPDVKTAPGIRPNPAVGDEADLVKDGASVHAYSQTTDYKTGVQTPRLLGLVEETMEDTAGAHPNHATHWADLGPHDGEAGRGGGPAQFRSRADRVGRRPLRRRPCGEDRAHGRGSHRRSKLQLSNLEGRQGHAGPLERQGQGGRPGFPLLALLKSAPTPREIIGSPLPVFGFPGGRFSLPMRASFAGTPPKRGSEP